MTELVSENKDICEGCEDVVISDVGMNEVIVDKDNDKGEFCIGTSNLNGSHNRRGQEEIPKVKNSSKKNKKNKKKRKEVIITDDDFGPIVDFTKREGFVYDPLKAEFDINEVHLEKRPWEIPDVRSVAYLRRLGICWFSYFI